MAADSSSSSPTKPNPNARDWANLPELVLVSIARRLVTAISSLSAFSSTCRRWRHSIRSSFVRSSTPPLLLTVDMRQTHSLIHPASGRHVVSPYRAPSVPSAGRDPFCWLGSSHGHLIFIRSDRRPRRSRVALFDPITGRQKLSPFLPAAPHPYYYAALTSPPSSRRSVLLLFYSRASFLYLRLGLASSSWSTHRLPRSIYITRVLSFKGDMVLGINNRSDKLVEFRCSGEPHEKIRVEVFDLKGIGPDRVFDRRRIGPQLIECGRDLLLLLFVLGSDAIRVECCRLDLDRMQWVDADGLGDHALYADFKGKCPVACYKPEQWGGASGCVYLSGPGSRTFVRLTVGGEMVPYVHDRGSPWWPSPFWIYPSSLF